VGLIWHSKMLQTNKQQTFLHMKEWFLTKNNKITYITSHRDTVQPTWHLFPRGTKKQQQQNMVCIYCTVYVNQVKSSSYISFCTRDFIKLCFSFVVAPTISSKSQVYSSGKFKIKVKVIVIVIAIAIATK